MKYIALFLIKLYKLLISPFLKHSCRFYPSCSTYGIESIQTWGFLKGSYLTVKRILRCHPFSEGGIDLVPPKEKDKQNG